MSNAPISREKILKSWAGVSEVALIKEVATKGEHIDLCIEYWARKRKLPQAEYSLFFHGVVQTYVNRLLSERLVCKAESVLRNVQRDVKCCYFQFACECSDPDLQEMVFEHLRRKDPQNYAQESAELKFNWDLLQQVRACPVMLDKCKTQLRRNVDLEAIVTCESSFRKRLEVELYFVNHNAQLLPRLDKTVLWNYLVETQQMTEIVRWCHLSTLNTTSLDNLKDEELTDLELKYTEWSIDSEMYEHALRVLQSPSEALRNCFASAGYYFLDERDNVALVLRRICTTQSFDRNQTMLEKLPLGAYLLQQGHYSLLLHDFVSERELEELTEKQPMHGALLHLLVALKEHDIQERSGFEQIARAVKQYLQDQVEDFDNAQPLATFYDFLCNEPTVSSLNCFLLSSPLKHIPYLRAMSQRLEFKQANQVHVPSAYDLLLKFKQLDFAEAFKERPEQVISFSNERLCQKYARNYELNYLHYLKQQRSSYAVYYLLTEQLQKYAQLKKSQLFSACETVTELALQHAHNTSLVAHCVAFIEMLGFNTQQLRSYLKLCRLLPSDVTSYNSLISALERVMLERLESQPVNADFMLRDYQALIRMAEARGAQNEWPQLVLRYYARNDDWWHLLLLLQFFNVPLGELQQLLPHFKTRTVGAHLLRALSHELPVLSERGGKWRSHSFNRQQSSRQSDKTTLTTSVETMNSSVSSCNDANLYFNAVQRQQLLRFLPETTTTDATDLCAIILLSNSVSSSGMQLALDEQVIDSGVKLLELLQDKTGHVGLNMATNLLRNCVKYRLPVLAILATTVSPENISWKWLVWLAVTTEQWYEVQRTVATDQQELSWRLVEQCVRLGYTDTLYRSFFIFHADNAFTHLLHFLFRTQHYRDFGDGVIQELRVFLLAWSNDEVQLPLCMVPLKREQVMLRSVRLLLVHLQHNFESTLEQQRFLSCICRSDMGDICVGWLDFCLLHRIFDVLQEGLGAGWPHRFPIDFEELLRRDNKSYERLLESLLDAKQYDVAVHLASLLLLPINDIVYAKWVAELTHEQSLEEEQQQLTFERYEQEIDEYSLPPALLVNFYLYAATQLATPSSRKYLLLKRALNVIKCHHLFPNETFDRDQIEYEMTYCYLHLVSDNPDLEIYHSEYYEQIMVRERCVLYKSFLELKELAGIDDLSISQKMELSPELTQHLENLLNRLLDEGDIVEALRLQEMFQCRPIDLRFLVFCMALAEGVTSIFNLSSDERQMLRDVKKSTFARFNKRTLDTLRLSGCQQRPASPLKGSTSGSMSNELSDSCSTLEFEEIPSKMKRETLDTIQGIASRLRCGVDLGRRVLMAYRAAMYLDKEYLDVLRTKDVSILLKSVSEDGCCLQRLLVVSDILTSTHMTGEEIADLLAFEMTTGIVRPRFYIFNADQHMKNTFKNADLWGYNIDRDLHLFLELTPSTTHLGNRLLEYCDALKAYRKFQDNKPFERTPIFEKLSEIISRYGLPTSSTNTSSSPAAALINTVSGAGPSQVLSHKKQNLIYVELLVKAHECFVHECCMEGIADVLHRAKSLTSTLTKAKSWSLIVRLLIGLARYREMFYCFEALIDNDQFESLLAQFDEEKAVGLRQAILAYLREYRPLDGKEYLKLAAHHFLMYKDLAEMWEQEAAAMLTRLLATAQIDAAQLPEQNSMHSLTSATIQKTCIPKLRSSTEFLLQLQHALDNYTHATENYLLDSKLLLAQKSASRAELVAVQMDLMTKAIERSGGVVLHVPLCVCVVNVQSRDEFRELVNAELSVPQTLILSRAYDFDINWAEAFLSQFIILQRRHYLDEYLTHLSINDSLIDNIVKGFQLYAQRRKTTPQMEEHLAQLVGLVKSITLKYRLASLLSLKSTVMSLLNEQTLYYLRDTNYGRNESNHNMSDM